MNYFPRLKIKRKAIFGEVISLRIHKHNSLNAPAFFYFQITALNSLKRWSELNRSSITAPTAYSQLTRQHSPFPLREDINGRFVLWEGDIALLNVDCITNPTNERLNESISAVSKRIINRAGPGLFEELKSIKGEGR